MPEFYYIDKKDWNAINKDINLLIYSTGFGDCFCGITCYRKVSEWKT